MMLLIPAKAQGGTSEDTAVCVASSEDMSGAGELDYETTAGIIPRFVVLSCIHNCEGFEDLFLELHSDE